jgi:hypothetical protein
MLPSTTTLLSQRWPRAVLARGQISGRARHECPPAPSMGTAQDQAAARHWGNEGSGSLEGYGVTACVILYVQKRGGPMSIFFS